MFAILALSAPGFARETPADLTTAANIEAATTTVIVTVGDPNPLRAHLRARPEHSICWRGEDRAYELRFASSQWAFREQPDRDDKNGDRIVVVPKGGCSRSFTLDYELKPGRTREHHYQVADPGEVGPTNGPAIVGEG